MGVYNFKNILITGITLCCHGQMAMNDSIMEVEVKCPPQHHFLKIVAGSVLPCHGSVPRAPGATGFTEVPWAIVPCPRSSIHRLFPLDVTEAPSGLAPPTHQHQGPPQPQRRQLHPLCCHPASAAGGTVAFHRLPAHRRAIVSDASSPPIRHPSPTAVAICKLFLHRGGGRGGRGKGRGN